MRNQSDPSQGNAIDRKPALRIGLTVLLFGVTLGLALNRDFYNDSMASAFLSLALASAAIATGILAKSAE